MHHHSTPNEAADMPPLFPAHAIRTSLLNVSCAEKPRLLQDRIRELSPAWDRQARREALDPGVHADVQVLADILPDCLGDRAARVLIAHVVVVGSDVDLVRYCLAELNSEIAAGWNCPSSAKPMRVTSTRVGRRA